jgi:hypothetical protein
MTATTTGRVTGIKNAELIDSIDKLAQVRDNMANDTDHWMLVTKLDWKTNGFAINNDVIYVPTSKANTKLTGDIIASVGDYVLNLNDGRKTIVFTPEIKARIADGDFSWFA